MVILAKALISAEPYLCDEGNQSSNLQGPHFCSDSSGSVGRKFYQGIGVVGRAMGNLAFSKCLENTTWHPIEDQAKAGNEQVIEVKKSVSFLPEKQHLTSDSQVMVEYWGSVTGCPQGRPGFIL